MTHRNIPASPDDIAFLGSLIGKPWRAGATGPEAYDCWSMAVAVQARLWGRDLPFQSQVDAASPRAVLDAIRRSALQRRWLPVERPAPGDLVLMARRGDPVHVGVWIDAGPGCTGVLHCAQGQGVMLQSLAQLRAVWGWLEFRRDAGVVVDALPPAEGVPMAPGEAAIVIVRDPLNPLDGAQVVALAGCDSVAGHLSRAAGLPEAYWVCLDAEPLLRRHPETGEDEWASRIVAPGQIIWVLPPLPEGDDASSILAVLATVVLAIAAPYAVAALGVAALGLTAATLTLAGQLVAAGIVLAGNLLISAFMPAQSAAGDVTPEAPSPTYSLRAPQNGLRAGAMIPVSYGTMRRVPDLLAQPYGVYAENEHYLHILLCVGQGVYQINSFGIEDTEIWNSATGFTSVLEDIDVQIVAPGERVTLFPSSIIQSSEVGGQELPVPATTSVIVGPYVAVPSGQTATRIVCDFAFPRGLFNFDNGVKATEVTWSIDVRQIDDAGTPLGAWVLAGSFSRGQATTTPQRLTRGFDVSEGRYEVRCRRTSASTISTQGQDQIVWAGLRAVVPFNQIYPDVTALAIRMRATETSSEGASRWYVDATRKLTHWNGTDWVFGATENIEAAVREVLLAPYGLDLDPAQVDWASLEALADVWAARGDVACLTIDTEQAAWDVLETVLEPGRSRPQFIGAMVTFVRDQPRAIPSQLITHADMVRGSFSVDRLHNRADAPNVVTVRYRNRQGEVSTVLCRPPGVTDPRPATVDRMSIVDRDHAFREGVYLAASNNLRRRFLSFTLLESGRALVRGDLIAVAHPRPSYGRPARVVSRAGLTLTLSEPHNITGTGDHLMAVQRPDGSFWGPVRVLAGADAHTLTIDGDDLVAVRAIPAQGVGYDPDPRAWIITEADLTAPEGETEALDAAQCEPARVAVGPEGAETLHALVVEAMPRADGSVEVLCVQEHAGVHTAEDGLVPPVAAPAASARVFTAPVWTGASARLRLATEPPSILVSGPSVPGARSYIAQVSTDGAAWGERVAALSPRVVVDVGDAESYEVRFAAVGLIRGPWGYATVDGVA